MDARPARPGGDGGLLADADKVDMSALRNKPCEAPCRPKGMDERDEGLLRHFLDLSINS
jgi:hypothetical protein